MPGINPNEANIPPAIFIARGYRTNCWPIWLPRFPDFDDARVTRIPAATEITSVGICDTNPSPIDNRVNFYALSARLKSI